MFFILLLSIFNIYAMQSDPIAIYGDYEIIEENCINILSPTILHFEKFNVDKNEVVNIIQKDKNSSLYIQVDEKISIEGRVTSNGRIALYSPSGITFHKESLVEANDFIATTLEISKQSFIDSPTGKWFYSGNSEYTIVNEGKIIVNDGNVRLVSYHVQNDGILQSKKGMILINSLLDF